METLIPVILCGGSGTRLWPLSRERYPKQLLALTGERSLLQATMTRVLPEALPEGWTISPPVVVANEQHRFLVAEQLRQIGEESARILLEPCGRNTAPAMTVAALLDAKADPVLAVMPADHAIADPVAFRTALAAALPHAAAGRMVTFGIVPTAPETGFGYLRKGEEQNGAYAVAAFVEKPDRDTAASYLASGDYLWNSGIFVVRASVWLQHLANLQPEMKQACEAAFVAGCRDGDFFRLDADAFAACPADSIDYAVMERLPLGETVVVPLAARWSDVGSWQALWELGTQDADGNVLTGDALAFDCQGCYVRAEHRLVACLGVDDLAVIETPDAVLVARRDHLQAVRQVVGRLQQDGRSESVEHRKVFRPWGHYDSVDKGARFQVKRIVVAPGASLSLQMHHHRAEHWIVVSGTAKVMSGDKTFLLTENQSTYIPLGVMHRLENPGRIPLEIIEVQSGSYLGEDDIVRFEDSYGRN